MGAIPPPRACIRRLVFFVGLLCASGIAQLRGGDSKEQHGSKPEDLLLRQSCDHNNTLVAFERAQELRWTSKTFWAKTTMLDWTFAVPFACGQDMLSMFHSVGWRSRVSRDLVVVSNTELPSNSHSSSLHSNSSSLPAVRWNITCSNSSNLDAKDNDKEKAKEVHSEHLHRAQQN